MRYKKSYPPWVVGRWVWGLTRPVPSSSVDVSLLAEHWFHWCLTGRTNQLWRILCYDEKWYNPTSKTILVPNARFMKIGRFCIVKPVSYLWLKLFSTEASRTLCIYLWKSTLLCSCVYVFLDFVFLHRFFFLCISAWSRVILLISKWEDLLLTKQCQIGWSCYVFWDQI